MESIHDGESNLALLHCVSSYPCSVADANLERVAMLRRTYMTVPVGLSDHTLGPIAPIVATALGASIIEKHITLDRNHGGPDAAFSLDPQEFADMVRAVKDAWASLGTGERPEAEEIYRELRSKS
jgi:sialic acid synthase SpsE